MKDFAEARGIFAEVCDLDRDERDRILDQRCGDRPHLRERIEALLEHHAAPPGLVDQGAVGPDGRELLARIAEVESTGWTR